jgi:hypothetical protein
VVLPGLLPRPGGVLFGPSRPACPLPVRRRWPNAADVSSFRGTPFSRVRAPASAGVPSGPDRRLHCGRGTGEISALRAAWRGPCPTGTCRAARRGGGGGKCPQGHGWSTAANAAGGGWMDGGWMDAQPSPHYSCRPNCVRSGPAMGCVWAGGQARLGARAPGSGNLASRSRLPADELPVATRAQEDLRLRWRRMGSGESRCST